MGDMPTLHGFPTPQSPHGDRTLPWESRIPGGSGLALACVAHVTDDTRGQGSDCLSATELRPVLTYSPQ